MKKILWMLVAVAAFAGCDDDGDATSPASAETLQLSAETLAFDADGAALSDETNQVTVSSSARWRLGGRQQWCTPSAVEGNGGETVSFTVEPNPVPRT